MSKVTKLITKLGEVENQLKELGDEAQIIRQMIQTEMEKDQLTQVKTKYATVSISRRVSYGLDEMQWRNWAIQNPELEVDLFYVTTVDKKKVVEQAERWLKETGEMVPGITAQQTEYLSIRKAKPAAQDNAV